MAEPIFKYIGAKQNLAPSIINSMPSHRTYIEVFFGGGSVFWKKPKAEFNIINDINKNIINLYKVLNDEVSFNKFKMALLYTPYSRYIFDEFADIYFNKKQEYDQMPSVKRALIYFYLIKTCFNGNINTKTLSVSLQYTTAWQHENIVTLEEAFKHLNSKNSGKNPVLIENMSYVDLLDKYIIKPKESYVKETLVYLDPPYWVTDKQNYYEFNFNKDEHIILRDKLIECDKAGCKWILSYDDVPEIRELYPMFHIKNTKSLAQTASNSDKKVEKKELLITNYNIETNTGLFSE